MARQVIFLGTNPNDHTGETLRGGGGMINENFEELYALQSDTINAGALAYSAATNHARVQLAIDDAVLLGKSRVFIPAQYLPYTPTTVTFNSAVQMVREGGDFSVYEAAAYGVPEDGTDATAALQALETVRPTAGTMRLSPGKTYGLAATTGATVFRSAKVGVWDFTGVTIQYTGATTEPLGSENAAISLLSVLHNGIIIIGGTLDCNSKMLSAVGVWDAVTQGPVFSTSTIIKNLYEGDTGRLSWSGVKYFVSVDVSGVAITTRALNISGHIVRPDCPVTSDLGTITGHGSISATLIGGNIANGNSSGAAIIGTPASGGNGWATQIAVPHTFAVPTSIPLAIGNTWLADWLMHDCTANVVELHGTSATNSLGFNIPAAYLMAGVMKRGTVFALAHDNLGSDGSYPNALLSGGPGAGQAFVDFDPAVAGSVGGGRFIHKLVTVTEAVLVSGVDASACNGVQVTLTAARVVGAPLNPRTGQRLSFSFLQSGAGGFAVTWNAVFSLLWTDAGNTATDRSYIEFEYDGTNWNQRGAQRPYRYRPPATLYTPDTLSTTSTSQVSLGSLSIPGNLLAVNGHAVRFIVRGRAITQNCVALVNYGAVTVKSLTVVAGTNFEIDAIIRRSGAATQNIAVNSVNGTTVALSTTFATETLSGAVTLDFRGSVTSGGTLVMDAVQVQYMAV